MIENIHWDSLFKTHGWIIPIFIITTFGFGYQAIPLFTWFYIPLVLIYTRNKPFYHLAIVYVVSSIAVSLGYLGNFKSTPEQVRFPLAWLIVAASFLVNLLVLISLAAERFILTHSKYVYTRVFFLPCVWTSLWFISSRFGILGDYPSFSTSLIQWAEFSQAASLGGRALLDFLAVLTGTILFELPSYPLNAFTTPTASTLLVNSSVADDEEDRDARASIPLRRRQRIEFLIHPVTIYSIIMLAIFTFGGISVNIRKGSFYQTAYPDFIPDTAPVGCVVGANELVPDIKLNHTIWFDKSSQLVQAGAKLIIWSELTVTVQDEEAEKALIKRTQEFAVANHVYLGITYALMAPLKNKFVFVTKQGEIGIDYNKAHPVPGVELQEAGPNVLQYVDTEEFGRIGAGICFDYNFADFIGQASTHHVDLMLQPSWTWGPIGTHHGQGNVLRAVENGFTLFRCVSQGVSGIYEPTLNGLFNQKVASLNDQHYLFYLPLQKRIGTLYGYIGDAFSYICAVVTIALLSLAYKNSKRQHQLTI